jgi:hypothetical protein
VTEILNVDIADVNNKIQSYTGSPRRFFGSGSAV